MKQRIIHIFAVCAALCLLVGCSCSDTKVISRRKMAQIYAEMLVMDQWLLEHSRYRTQADTSLVYEPIFQKYGYTTEDYRASLEHYMNDPERYSRILRKTAEILEEQIEELKVIKAIEDRLKAVVPYKMDPDRLYYGRSKDRLWNFGDSVSVALDSAAPVFEFSFHELSDTLFDGLNIIVNVDTLEVKDTLPKEEAVSPQEPEPVKELVPVKAPEPVKDNTPVKEPASPKVVKTTTVKPNQLLSKEPQRLFSKTLDSLKRN